VCSSDLDILKIGAFIVIHRDEKIFSNPHGENPKECSINSARQGAWKA